MRIMNFMLKSIIILMLIVLVGCNNDNKNNNTNGNNKAGLVQLKNDNQDEGELVYSIKKGKNYWEYLLPTLLDKEPKMWFTMNNELNIINIRIFFIYLKKGVTK